MPAYAAPSAALPTKRSRAEIPTYREGRSEPLVFVGDNNAEPDFMFRHFAGLFPGDRYDLGRATQPAVRRPCRSLERTGGRDEPRDRARTSRQ
jgi:hypothetical protein